ncbi:MAG: hypothetical protein HZT42_15140 [Paracoccaceae bacterium]|nr:MAG: hypothetical protein HZT42_15140 [Paracoccaceae bacterium]
MCSKRMGDSSQNTTRKKGDFIYIPSGTVHALGPGVVLLEIQQTSDRTYRLYDFDRVDDTGNLRELHIEKAVEVMNIPDRRTEELIRTDLDSGLTTELISKPSFTIMRHQVDGTPAILERAETFRLISVVSGEGFVQDEDGTQAIRAGEHYFIPKEKDLTCSPERWKSSQVKSLYQRHNASILFIKWRRHRTSIVKCPVV